MATPDDSAVTAACLDARSRARLADSRFTAAGLLFEAADGLRDMLAAALTDTQLNGAELQVLMRLARSPGFRLRMADLAAQVAMSASGLTRLVDRLEREGLVERAACPTDRRGAFAVATDAGIERITAQLDVHLDTIDRYFTGRFDRHELERFTAALRELRDIVRPDAAAGAEGTVPAQSPS